MMHYTLAGLNGIVISDFTTFILDCCKALVISAPRLASLYFLDERIQLSPSLAKLHLLQSSALHLCLFSAFWKVWVVVGHH